MSSEPEPSLPLLSIITKRASHLKTAASKLRKNWPAFRLTTPRHLFNESDYYAEEMGEPLFRWWGYRKTLADPSQLRAWKKTCEAIEDELRDSNEQRTVNIDPGYLNYGLVVLGSHKHHHQKIYLGNGVYADPVLEYIDGSYRPFHWTFPDFQDDRYYPLLEELRKTYKALRQENDF